MSILGIGEKGVGGVPGPPVVLVVPADVRFMMRLDENPGDLMLEEPELSELFDLEELSDCAGIGSPPTGFGVRPLLENKPIFLLVCYVIFENLC